MGRKRGAVEAAQFLVDGGIEIVCMVGPAEERHTPSLRSFAGKNRISFFSDDAELYKMLKMNSKKFEDIDLVISYLYWKKIKEPLIGLPKRGCINFHPAPLPDYKSRAGYNTAILDDRGTYGVSAHYIDSEKFDSGPIIKRLDFAIDVKNENALSLYTKAQTVLLKLFKQTIEVFCETDKISTKSNVGGLYLTSEQLEKLKEVNLKKDSLEKIDKKIRAFFFPPYGGAYIKVGGQKVGLINQNVLSYLSKFLGNG